MGDIENYITIFELFFNTQYTWQYLCLLTKPIKNAHKTVLACYTKTRNTTRMLLYLMSINVYYLENKED